MSDYRKGNDFYVDKQELFYYDEIENVYKPLVNEDGMLPIQSVQKKWKDSFTSPLNALDSEKWKVDKIGAGQSVSVVNGELVITAGTTPNSETIITTKEVFTDPFRALFGFKLSQKIVNQAFFFEAISVNKDTLEPDGLHTVAWRLSGDDAITMSTGVYETQNGGMARLASANISIINTISAYSILELELFADEVWYHSRAMDSPNGRSASFVRQQQIPDPNALFKVRIRAVNKAVAPVSQSTLTFQFITVVDYAELTAEITSGRGNISAGQGMAMTVAGGTLPTVTTVTTAYTASKMVFATDNTLNQQITTAVPFLSPVKDTSSTPTANTMRVRLFSSHAGTLELYNGSNATLLSNKVAMTVSVEANKSIYVELPLVARYAGYRFINTGGATTTAFEALSAMVG